MVGLRRSPRLQEKLAAQQQPSSQPNNNARERTPSNQSSEEPSSTEAASSDLYRASSEEDAREAAHHHSSSKRSRKLVDSDENQPTKRPRVPSSNDRDPVRYWVSQGSWPPNYCNTSNMTLGSTGRLRIPSHTEEQEEAEDGDLPAAHSAISESHLAAHGVILDPSQGQQFLFAESKDLCYQMYHGSLHENLPKVSPCIGYPIDKLDSVLGKLHTRNEACVTRDLTALLIPSAENLAFSGMPGLDDIAEDLSADWSKVATLGGPTPRPDITVGLAPTAFSNPETKKLDNYKTWDSATSFTLHVLFPFLICELKSSEQAIARASRQAGHSGAIATQAIWKLYDSLKGHHERHVRNSKSLEDQSGVSGEDQADVPANEAQRKGADGGRAEKAANVSVDELNGEVLVFSIAHDNATVELYGHFPVFNHGDIRPTIHRHLIDAQNLWGGAQERSRKIRDFVLRVYLDFSQTHLKRIKRALEAMPEPVSDAARLDSDAKSMLPPSESASQMRERKLVEQINEMKAEWDAEKVRAKAERERADAEREAEQERAEAARKAEQERAEADRKAEQERVRAERDRAKAEMEAERERAKAEREAERDQARADREAMQAQISELMNIVKQATARNAA